MTRRRSRWVLIALVLLLLALDTYATHALLTSRYTGCNDFYPRWRGAQLYWRTSLNPYSDAATRLIQQDMYGRPARPDEDQVQFAYPFYVVFLLLPLVWLPYPWVQAVWMVLLEAAVVWGTLLALDLTRWRLPPWLWGLTVLWGLFFYHNARTISLGQFAGWVFLWAMGTLWALRARRDILAGVLLALTSVKPQMSVLLIPALLWWGWRRRRRFLAAAGLTLVLLAGLSFVFLPTWAGDMLRQIRRYPSYTSIGSPVWVITRHYLHLGPLGEGLPAAALLLYLLWELRRLPHAPADSDAFLWLVGMTLVVTNLIVTRTATTNYVILYLPLFLALAPLARRYGNGPVLASFYLLSAAAVWWLFLATFNGRTGSESPLMYLPLPLGVLGALLLVREQAIATGHANGPGSSSPTRVRHQNPY